MDVAEQTVVPDPETGTEVSVAFDDILFSRVDGDSVIVAANQVFRRVSGFEWSEMIGATDLLVRHPDMPQGVFHLFWQYLNADQPFAAYLKNRCKKDGDHYWIFIVVSPSDGGYFALRIKPSTPHLDRMFDIYEQLRGEEERGLPPEKSAEKLIDLLRGQGFAGYDAFQITALTDEFISREEALGRTRPPIVGRYQETARAVAAFIKETEGIRDDLRAIRDIPLNMRVIASRLGEGGRPIFAIADNFSLLTNETDEWVASLLNNENSVFVRLMLAIERAGSAIIASLLQEEMQEGFEHEASDLEGCFDLKKEQQNLTQQSVRLQENVRLAMEKVKRDTAKLKHALLDMKRFLAGFSSTRMMCRIERETLGDPGVALDRIVDQLESCQSSIDERLIKISSTNARIPSSVSTILASVQRDRAA